jgi:hypothetical protein
VSTAVPVTNATEDNDEPDWLKEYTIDNLQKKEQIHREERKKELQKGIERARKREQMERNMNTSWSIRQQYKKNVRFYLERN